MTRPQAIAATLHDAVALAEILGPCSTIAIGPANVQPADIIAPAGPHLTPQEALQAAKSGAKSYVLAFANAAPPNPAEIAPLIETLTQSIATGFLAACIAAPWAGRTTYQGHLFEHTILRANLIQSFAHHLGGPIALIPHATVTSGVPAIRASLATFKERGHSLAFIDAINDDDCKTIAEALGTQLLTGGAAWAAPAGNRAPEPPRQTPTKFAIFSGALDRVSISQIAAARREMPVFDIDFATPNPVTQAVQWARTQTQPYIIASTAPPDLITQGAQAAVIIGQIAKVLNDEGLQNFVINGGKTAAAILSALNVTNLTTGPAAFGPMRWLQAPQATFCIKPPGSGPKSLFLPELGPQIRLNEPAK